MFFCGLAPGGDADESGEREPKQEISGEENQNNELNNCINWRAGS